MTQLLALRRTISAITIIALLLLFPVAGGSSVRYNRTITVTAGTSIQLTTTSRYLVRAIFIQMAIGGSGYGAVMAGIVNGRTPSKSTSGDLTAQLAPASATAPGSSYSDSNQLGIDLSTIWVDGSNSGDTIIVSYDVL